MKKKITILLILFAVLKGAYTQEASDYLRQFREKTLPAKLVYFSDVALSESRLLLLNSTEKYDKLAIDDKKKQMNEITMDWPHSLVLVKHFSKFELWGRSSDNSHSILLDTWDTNPMPVSLQSVTQSQPSTSHPWFFYLGGLLQLNTDKYINIAFNTRVGFFLLLERWDLALTYSASKNGYIESPETMGINSIGLMSKVYFPLKKFNLYPNAGLEISRNSTKINETWNNSLKAYLLTGISWYVGPGSLDLSFRIGDNVTSMVGYSFMPGNLGKKKK